MRDTDRKLPKSRKEQGALLILTLLILLVVSMLGMAAIDSTGLEMKMASNSRLQQEAFEAAEYTLSWVENDIATSGYFSQESVTNVTGCNSICFNSTCTNGYCFSGDHAEGTPGPFPTANDCRPLNVSATEPYADSTIWATAGNYKTVPIPNSNITAKYVVEFWCYTAKYDDFEMKDTNFTRMYRITAYAVGEDGKARAMLRSTIREI